MVFARDGDVSSDKPVVRLQFLLPPTLRPIAASRTWSPDTSCSLWRSLSSLARWLCATTSATTTATGSPL